LGELYPRQGVVKKSGNYYYLEISDGGGYTQSGSEMLSITEIYLQGYGIYPPPSPVGSHVTLRSPLPPQELGKVYTFNLDQRVVTYPHEKQGKAPSSFDPTLYPVSWYVIYVKGLPSHIVNPYDPPHISIAVMGYRK